MMDPDERREYALMDLGRRMLMARARARARAAAPAAPVALNTPVDSGHDFRSEEGEIADDEGGGLRW